MKGGGYSVRSHANRDGIKMQSWVGLRMYMPGFCLSGVLQAGTSGESLIVLVWGIARNRPIHFKVSFSIFLNAAAVKREAFLFMHAAC